jgi:hypothetical protein
MQPSGLLCNVVCYKLTNKLIVLIMEAASTPETSINFYHTSQPNQPEDSHLHTRRRENLNFMARSLLSLAMWYRSKLFFHWLQ